MIDLRDMIATSILSSGVASKFSTLGFTPKRLAGTSRNSTSVAVASAPDHVFLATGTDYHSALAAASAAGADGTSGKSVVVLNDGNMLTSSVKSCLNSLGSAGTPLRRSASRPRDLLHPRPEGRSTANESREPLSRSRVPRAASSGHPRHA
ncbi:hypothetical protein ACFY0F_10520 [Streptomyces sp. NPDC001544]|uniref:hypothetical protein n=1 Tax=Streptomyces sp. NPDC001544 TaxID=3364584 RepID=UPI0036AE8DFB